MKSINEFVISHREIIKGVYSPKGELKHISSVSKKDKIYCPECLEPVKNHSKSKVPHYEHLSKEGKSCSFKIT